MRFFLMIPFTLGLIACNPEPDPQDTGDSDDTDEPLKGYPSSYEEATYRVSSLSLNEMGVGVDLNGDSLPDNKLPDALTLIDFAIADQDFSLDGFNTLIAESIEGQILNILLGTSYEMQALGVTVYSGVWDEEANEYSIDPGSYDEAGNPVSSFAGYFDSETDFAVSAEAATLPVTFIASEGPLPVPLRMATISGTATNDGMTGQITGVIPGDDMVNDVISPMIPEEGAGGMSYEQIMELVQNLTKNETLMDVPLDDGKRGISAAFTFSSEIEIFAVDEEE